MTRTMIPPGGGGSTPASPHPLTRITTPLTVASTLQSTPVNQPLPPAPPALCTAWRPASNPDPNLSSNVSCPAPLIYSLEAPPPIPPDL